MRSPSAAWLLGAAILLAASISCNGTIQGEKPGQGGLLSLRSWGPGHAGQTVGSGQVREGCSAAGTHLYESLSLPLVALM